MLIFSFSSCNIILSNSTSSTLTNQLKINKYNIISAKQINKMHFLCGTRVPGRIRKVSGRSERGREMLIILLIMIMVIIIALSLLYYYYYYWFPGRIRKVSGRSAGRAEFGNTMV